MEPIHWNSRQINREINAGIFLTNSCYDADAADATDVPVTTTTTPVNTVRKYFYTKSSFIAAGTKKKTHQVEIIFQFNLLKDWLIKFNLCLFIQIYFSSSFQFFGAKKVVSSIGFYALIIHSFSLEYLLR